MSAKQRDGTTLQAERIYNEALEWLKGFGCAEKIFQHLLERYAMCLARWIQCEEMTSKVGFLSKNPKTNEPDTSPFVNIGIDYINQADKTWNEIFQIVKENCNADGNEFYAHNDLMKRLIQARKEKIC